MTGLDFGFLTQRAGFQLAESLLGATPDDSYGWLLLAGAVDTLAVAALALPLATLAGTALGLARLTRQPLVHRLLALLVAPVRNTPVLLQLFVWYALLLALPQVREAWQPLPGVFLSNRGLALPALHGAGPLLLAGAATALAWWLLRRRLLVLGLGLAACVAAVAMQPLQLELPQAAGFGLRGGWTLSPEFAALVLGLTLFHCAYIADIVRGAVLAVPAGQVDAGRALGLAPGQLARLVLAPHAARLALPPYASQCLMLLKNSTLAIAIGYQDLMAVVNTTVTQTGRAVEGITLAALFYLAISLLVAWTLARANARATRQGLEGGGVQRLGQRLGPVGWHGALRWRTPLQAAWQLALAGCVAWGGWQLLQWAVLRAQWHGSPADCAAAAGACWAAVWENRTLLLFGTMPAAQRPQAAWTCALLLAAALLPLLRPLAPRWRAAACLLALAGAAATLAGLGGRPPLAPVAWGGLLVTLALALAAMALALPLAVLLALARWQRHRALRWPATALVETVRAVPLVTQLLLVAFWVPLLVGGNWSGAKFQLALAALALHTGCQLAEVLRGALQAIPASQALTAQALGLRPLQVLAEVLLPQARRLAAPAALGVFVGALKDTSLVLVIGLFDVLGAAKAVVADTGWRPYDLEVYGAVALLFLLGCLPLAWQAQRMQLRAA